MRKNEKNISKYIVPLLKNCAFTWKLIKIEQIIELYHFYSINFNKTHEIDHFAIAFRIEYLIVFSNFRKNANFHIRQMTDTAVNSHGTLFEDRSRLIYQMHISAPTHAQSDSHIHVIGCLWLNTSFSDKSKSDQYTAITNCLKFHDWITMKQHLWELIRKYQWSLLFEWHIFNLSHHLIWWNCLEKAVHWTHNMELFLLISMSISNIYNIFK